MQEGDGKPVCDGAFLLLEGQGVNSEVADSQIGRGKDHRLEGMQSLLQTPQVVSLPSQRCQLKLPRRLYRPAPKPRVKHKTQLLWQTFPQSGLLSLRQAGAKILQQHHAQGLRHSRL